MLQFQSAFGLIVFMALAWGIGQLITRSRRNRGLSRQSDSGAAPEVLGATIPWRFIGIALALQIVLALVLTRVPVIRSALEALNDVVLVLQDATQAGSSFVFGYLGGGGTPFEVTNPGSGFILAFQALPLLILISAMSALLFHWGILPRIVRAFAWVLNRSLRVSGSVGIGAAANVFIGMVEAPLLVRPYLHRLSRTDLFMIMTCGMATIAGTVMVLYATFLQGVIADPAGQLLAASIISAPAALLIARLMIPPQASDPVIEDETEMAMHEVGDETTSAMDAIVRGTLSGVTLFLNVVAMLFVMVALVHIVNLTLGALPEAGGEPLTLQRIFGWFFAPLAWAMGLPWVEAVTAGELLGTKTVLNELLAYLQFSGLPADALSDRSKLIMTYALCGFANFASLGIMVGGLAAIATERRSEIVELGGWSLIGGTLATMMTGAVVGLVG